MVRMDKCCALVEAHHARNQAIQRIGDRHVRQWCAERQPINSVHTEARAECRLRLRNGSLRRYVVVVLRCVDQSESLTCQPVLNLCHLVSSWRELLSELRGRQVVMVR